MDSKLTRAADGCVPHLHPGAPVPAHLWAGVKMGLGQSLSNLHRGSHRTAPKNQFPPGSVRWAQRSTLSTEPLSTLTYTSTEVP